MSKKKNEKKYSDIVKTLKYCGLDDEQIHIRLTEMEDLNEWQPITLRELQQMNEEHLSQLLVYTWKDDNPRGGVIGLTDLAIQEEKIKDRIWYSVSFSDEEGDPSFVINELDDVLAKVDADCGTWRYGVYRKK